MNAFNLYVDVSTKGYMELAWPHRAQVPLQLPPDRGWIDAYEYTPDGVLKPRVGGLPYFPQDTTAPGRLGANSVLYDAVGVVTLTAAAARPKAQRFQNYAGALADIRIYNRALTAAEVTSLSSN